MLRTCPLIQAALIRHQERDQPSDIRGFSDSGPRMRLSAEDCRSGHCGTDRIASVAVNPGATALQRIPSFPHREATCLVSAPIPALAVA